MSRMGGYRHLFRAILSREITLRLRYPFEMVGGVIMLTALFATIFVGGSVLAPGAMADSTEGIVVGFFLWILAIGGYGDISAEVMSEASWGTLERHYLTPFGFGGIFLAKAVGKLLTNFLLAAGVLFGMVVLTGSSLRIDLLTVVPIAVCTVASAFGIGIGFGGLLVLYKNLSSFGEMVNFLLAGMIAAPVFGNDLLLLLPLAQGSALLQRAMREGVRLWEFETLSLAILVVTGAGYLLLGYVVFHLCQRRARRLGVLGDY